MAYLKTSETQSGLAAPLAYWRVYDIYQNIHTGVATLRFVAYASAKDRRDGKPPVPGLVKEYKLTPEQFALMGQVKADDLFSGQAPPGTIVWDINMRLFYRIAAETRDTPIVNEDNEETLVSFFHDATIV